MFASPRWYWAESSLSDGHRRLDESSSRAEVSSAADRHRVHRMVAENEEGRSAHQQLQAPFRYFNHLQRLFVGPIDKHLSIGNVNAPRCIAGNTLATPLGEYAEILQRAIGPHGSTVCTALSATTD